MKFFIILTTIFILFFNFKILVYADSQYKISSENNYELGVKLYNNGEYLEAIDYFEKSIKNDPENGNIYYYLGLCYIELEDFNEALNNFKKSDILYGKTNINVKYSLGFVYIKLGLLDKALLEFEEVIKQKDNYPDLALKAFDWINIIKEEKSSQNLKEISKSIQEGIEYYKSQEYHKALILFKKAFEKAPNSSLISYYLGSTYYLLALYNESITYFQKVIEIDPESKIAQQARDYIKAIRDFTGINKKPVYFNLSLGSFYDSNVAYISNYDLQIGQPPIYDITGVTNLELGFFSPNWEARFSSYGNFNTTLLTNPEFNIKSPDYNLNIFNTSVLHTFPLMTNLFEFNIDTNLNFWLLGYQPYLLGGLISPSLTFYLNSNLPTVIKYNFELIAYPQTNDRNSLNNIFGIYQYFYLGESNELWIRLGYEFQSIMANDKEIIVKTPEVYKEKNSNLIYEPRKIEKRRYANSFYSNGSVLSFGIPLWWESKLFLNSRLSFLNYTTEEVYRNEVYNFDPITSQIELNKEKTIDLSPKELRFDTRLEFNIEYTLPINDNWDIILYYNYIMNMSNITKEKGYYTDRNYNKFVTGLNFRYNF